MLQSCSFVIQLMLQILPPLGTSPPLPPSFFYLSPVEHELLEVFESDYGTDM